MPYPDNFPPNCPPLDAKPPNFLVYRLLVDYEVRDSDFLSHVEARIPFSPDNHCSACGLSVYSELKEAKRQLKWFSKAGRARSFKAIAGGFLGTERGLIHRGGKGSHHSWWPPVGHDRKSGFEIVPLAG